MRGELGLDLTCRAERGLIGMDDDIVLLSTGSGLKDVPSAMRAVSAAGTEPLRIPPDIEALERALADRKDRP